MLTDDALAVLLPADAEDVFVGARPPYRRVPAGRVVGRDLEADFVVADEGRVSAVLDDWTAFVNASPEQFTGSINRYVAYRNGGDGESLRADLAAIDQEAVDDPGAYWALICEQVEDGLL